MAGAGAADPYCPPSTASLTLSLTMQRHKYGYFYSVDVEAIPPLLVLVPVVAVVTVVMPSSRLCALTHTHHTDTVSWLVGLMFDQQELPGL